jgi:hypothetical protein
MRFGRLIGPEDNPIAGDADRVDLNKNAPGKRFLATLYKSTSQEQ